MPELSDLSLYQTAGCPYCVRVRSAMQSLGVEIESRDINADSALRRELSEATGRQTVPCLRIDHGAGRVEWMHESEDIIAYLRAHFGS